jgi:hypothetical protein
MMSRIPSTIRAGVPASASRVGTSSPIAPCGMWSTSTTSGSKLVATLWMVALRSASTSWNGADRETGDQWPGPTFRIDGSLR